MKEIILMVIAVLLSIISIIAYVIVMSEILPRFILKRRYNIKDHLGRGIKKLRSLNGRAVVYEPHPSVRKYIRKHSLVVNNGYKYLECNVDDRVKTIRYTVMAMNNQNNLIDVLEVSDNTRGSLVTHPVSLNPDTSYVALAINSVNGTERQNTDVSYYKLRDVIYYALAVSGLSFAELCMFSWCGNFIINSMSEQPLGIKLALMLFYSILIGIISAFIFIFHCNKKKTKVIWNEKQ